METATNECSWLWYRPCKKSNWKPLRTTATALDAVKWIGVGHERGGMINSDEHNGGDWLVLRFKVWPDQGIPADQKPYHKFEMPKDASYLKVVCPAPTEEQKQKAVVVPSCPATLKVDSEGRIDEVEDDKYASVF